MFVPCYAEDHLECLQTPALPHGTGLETGQRREMDGFAARGGRGVNAVPLPWLCRADFRPVDELPGEGQTEADTARLAAGP